LGQALEPHLLLAYTQTTAGGVVLASTRLLDLFEDGIGLLLAGLDGLRKAIDRHGLLPYARAHYWEHLNKRQGATLLSPRDLLGSPTPDVRRTPLLLPRVDSLRGAWTAPDTLPDFAEMAAGLGTAPHQLEGPGAALGSPEERLLQAAANFLEPRTVEVSRTILLGGWVNKAAYLDLIQ
jgi:hypothetical protein